MGIYNRRLYPWTTGDNPVDIYWRLRKSAVLYDVPESPIEIEGPDVARFLDLIFTRNVQKMRIGRAAYGMACLPNGGVLMDGMLMRLSENKFWFVQADGEFLGWLSAHAIHRDVTIRDPRSWAVQVQGPTALDVLQDVCEDAAPQPFNYFDVAECAIAGQRLLVSRTGWTGELGFELYTLDEHVDGPAIWNHLLEVGQDHGLVTSGLESMGIRRIEAGIMDYGTDLNVQMTPYQAGLGKFVDMNKPDFIGKEALMSSDQRPLLHGFACGDGAPARESTVFCNGTVVGRVTSAAWSPFLNKGIGFWCATEPADWSDQTLEMKSADGTTLNCRIAEVPFYDAKKEIPRGLATMA